MPADLPAELDRRFEAFVFDWEGTAVSDRKADASAVRAVVERLCALGAAVGIISDTDLATLDAQLGARPAGPGRLLLCVNGGSELFRVDAEGPQLVGDAKHLDVGPTDKAVSARRLFDELWRLGIGSGLVLIGGNELVPVDGLPRSDSRRCVPEAARATMVSVSQESSDVDARVVAIGGGPAAFVDLLEDQVGRREQGDVPRIDEDPTWTVSVVGLDPERERAREALLALADGRIGSNGAPLWTHPAAKPRVLAGGVYTGSGPETTVLEAPVWQQVEGRSLPSGKLARTLDMHTGVLRHVLTSDAGSAEAAVFSSRARPGTVALRLVGPDALAPAQVGQHSIRISDQWRICFVWRDGDAYDVEIVDYH